MEYAGGVQSVTDRPTFDPHCFCCGESNAQGLKLRYRYPRPGQAATAFTIPDHFTGWKEVVHGGLLAMVLDETMAHACASKGLNGFTGEISVRFRQPVRVGTAVEAAGRILSERRRVITAAAQLTAGGATIAEAEATFFVPPESAAPG